MKVAILGMPQAGGAELFSILTGVSAETTARKPLEAHPGICPVRDPRLQVLAPMYRPEKIVPARIEFALLPDFALDGPARSVVMNGLRDSDAICWVSHAEHAAAEVSAFLAELIVADLLLVEKRLENIGKAQKKKPSDALEKESRLMGELRALLEEGKPLSSRPRGPEQMKELSSYQLLTLIPLLVALNIPEDRIADASLTAGIRERFSVPCVGLSVGLEEELSRLDEKERDEFMKELGIAEPAVDRMTRLIFDALGLISFFTVGDDEVRAWPLRKGLPALEAAHTIHSDLARGFIRAEMMKYADLAAAGSEGALKDGGKVYLKGKDYVVEDGDILCIRFSV